MLSVDILAGKILTSKDIANVACFLDSDEAKFVRENLARTGH